MCWSAGPTRMARPTWNASAPWTPPCPSSLSSPSRTGRSSAMTISATRIVPLALAGALLLAMPARSAASAHITVVNADGPNEGFNDPTPAAPVGGNPGTTKGQQRLIAFQFAADLWGASLDSNIDIQIQASFDPLGANVLGAAGPALPHRNFHNPAAARLPGAGPHTKHHNTPPPQRA